MTRFSGKFPRNHAGKYCDVNMDLPWRGGMVMSRRRTRPAVTAISLRLSKFRCGASCHRWLLSRIARAAGDQRRGHAENALCKCCEEFTGIFLTQGLLDVQGKLEVLSLAAGQLQPLLVGPACGKAARQEIAAGRVVVRAVL